MAEESYDELEICAVKKKTKDSEALDNSKGSVSLDLVMLSRDEVEKGLAWYAIRFSSYNQIIRWIGSIRRFIYNCKKSLELRVTGELITPDWTEAEQLVMRLIQQKCFTDKSEEMLRSLNAFRSEDGLLRIRTKLVQRPDTYGFRYPVVLPAIHQVIRLLIRNKHEDLNHAWLQVLMSNLRENF